jgi:hypothetical protein
MTHDTFVAKVQAKFKAAQVGLKYKDEDDSLITILDESDWESGEFPRRIHMALFFFFV